MLNLFIKDWIMFSNTFFTVLLFAHFIKDILIQGGVENTVSGKMLPFIKMVTVKIKSYG